MNVKLIYPSDNIIAASDSDTESHDTMVVPEVNEIFVEEES